jgi:hypothetical protein
MPHQARGNTGGMDAIQLAPSGQIFVTVGATDHRRHATTQDYSVQFLRARRGSQKPGLSPDPPGLIFKS